jgi:hypothetical protein
MAKCFPCGDLNTSSSSSFGRSLIQYERKYEIRNSSEEQTNLISDSNNDSGDEDAEISIEKGRRKTNQFKYEFEVRAKVLDFLPKKFCRNCWSSLYKFTKYRMDEASRNMKAYNAMRLNPDKVAKYNDNTYHDFSYNETFDLFINAGTGVKQGTIFIYSSFILEKLKYHTLLSYGNDSMCFNQDKLCKPNFSGLVYRILP